MKIKMMIGVGFLFAVFAGGAVKSFAQVGKDERKIRAVGTVTGTIHIRSVYGNNLGDFGCKNLVVRKRPHQVQEPREAALAGDEEEEFPQGAAMYLPINASRDE